MGTDRYLRYTELTELLNELAATHPGVMRLQSLGHSHEGRDIWLATLTRFATGAAEDKPALWVDANIHSAELVGSMAALHLIEFLLREDGNDPDVSRCLDQRAFYICPRVNPDGAEWALADVPKLVRSGTRPWPDRDPLPTGLEAADIDGDGRILTMRIADPNGPWKISDDEPRLLVRRDPAEHGGRYFRLLPEGRIHDYDGDLLPAEKRRENLDLNRNYPGGWRGEHEQPGAGAYPASEPEVRAVVDFIARHPNICSGIALHSYSGLLLRPWSDKPDDEMPAEDLWVYGELGRQGTALTGYPAISAYHGFRYHPREVITGAMDDWLYGELGRYAWTVELWSPLRRAGIETERHIDWYRDHPFADDRKLLAWSDHELEGRGYIDWYPFEHPQLGPIELGGWDSLYSFWNPPVGLLRQETGPLARWLLWHNLISPRLELLRFDAKRIADDHWQVTAIVQNSGWLPTDITRLARQRGLVKPLSFTLQSNGNAQIVQPCQQILGGNPEGRAHKPGSPNVWAGRPSDPTDDRAKAEWLVCGRPGDRLDLVVRHERAGRIHVELRLA